MCQASPWTKIKNATRVGIKPWNLTNNTLPWGFFFGVDFNSGLAHTLVSTAANTQDQNLFKHQLQRNEVFAAGGAGYQGEEMP